MNAINEFLYNVLVAINGVVGNYGVAIIIFTILVRLICMPFDYKSRKGMRKMQVLQPKINELQKKYQNDPQKLQQKQAELMRKEGYSMFSGCLPLLLTWPLMLAMFYAMRSVANEQLAMQTFKYLAGESNIVTAADRFLWVKNIWITDSFFAPVAPNAATLNLLPADVWQKAYNLLSDAQKTGIAQSLAAVTEQALDFSTTDAMRLSVANMLSALENIPAYTAAIATVPGWSNVSILFNIIVITAYQHPNGLLILPVLAGVTQVLQYKFNPQMVEQQQMQATNPQQNNGMTKFMQYFFPILSVYFCLSSNAGFSVYWVTSTLVMWLQSIIITTILKKQDEKKAQSVSGEGSVK